MFGGETGNLYFLGSLTVRKFATVSDIQSSKPSSNGEAEPWQMPARAASFASHDTLNLIIVVTSPLHSEPQNRGQLTSRRLCAEVPAGVNSRDTGMSEMPNRGTSGIVRGSDITFRRDRRVLVNQSVRLASFI